MKTIAIELPDDAISESWGTDEEFARELRRAAAIQWYSEGKVSQGKGAELAGLTRQAFIEALNRAAVPATQATLAEIAEELAR